MQARDNARSALHMYAHREYEILFRLETMIDYMDRLPSHTGLFKDTEQWSLQYDTTVQLPTGMYARSTASQHGSQLHKPAHLSCLVLAKLGFTLV